MPSVVDTRVKVCPLPVPPVMVNEPVPERAVPDNDPPERVPPEIFAPLIRYSPERFPPVIKTLLALWVAIVPRFEISLVEIANRVLTSLADNAIGVAGEPVLLPIMELAARLAIFARVTFPEPMAVKPVLSIDMSPVTATPVAILLPLPTKILAEVSVFESLADKEATRSVW